MAKQIKRQFGLTRTPCLTLCEGFHVEFCELPSFSEFTPLSQVPAASDKVLVGRGLAIRFHIAPKYSTQCLNADPSARVKNET